MKVIKTLAFMAWAIVLVCILDYSIHWFTLDFLPWALLKIRKMSKIIWIITGAIGFIGLFWLLGLFVRVVYAAGSILFSFSPQNGVSSVFAKLLAAVNTLYCAVYAFNHAKGEFGFSGILVFTLFCLYVATLNIAFLFTDMFPKKAQ